ncbi:Golgin subfamily A member 6-like protein [Melia azedarach]|uniref:Golgin subfamily A member 6-like protein n=1 Tax=Melia azedarach TaxID=155640 RepID=A0ACC1X988_MELAZ|nr:Golgin subfamily A member 6-like protein [Melia azedarach]
MEESQKMVALKKAYAEMILNTAKEAAARIMVSERKAMRFEKDLNSSKEEALRFLLRLKQMIDSTTKEAAETSLSQQRKIDELEAQLHEAEDVITDLRSELRWVRDKLEMVRNNQPQPLNAHIKKETHKNVTVEPIVPSISDSQFERVTTSDTENNPLNLRILDNRNCSTTQQTENFSGTHLDNNEDHTPNLASTIARSKEPELYKNGCTQRIRALERNLLNGELALVGSIDAQHTVKNDLMIETSDKVVGNCAAPSPKTKDLDFTKKYSGAEVKKPIKVRTLRRRKTRFGTTKTAVRRSRLSQPKKLSRLSSVPSHCKSYSGNGNVRSEVTAHTLPSFKAGNMDNGKSYGDLDEKLLHKRSFNEEEIKISPKGKENIRVPSRAATATSFLSPDQLIKPYGLKTAENEAKMKPLPRLDPGLTLIRSGVDPISGSKNVTVSVKALHKSGLVQKAEDKDEELRGESPLVKPEGVTVENSKVVGSELSLEVVNVPMLSELKDAKSSLHSDGSPSKPDFNRVVKYTFQRKRKKESMSISGANTSPDKTIVKRRAAEKQDDAPEPEKSYLINESSRDSRRMAQVARQLISLSGRRW